MNRNLNEAIFDIAKVEAIMFAFENTYLELDVAPADRARADMATDAFYALWDAIRKVSDDLAPSGWRLPSGGCHLRRQ